MHSFCTSEFDSFTYLINLLASFVLLGDTNRPQGNNFLRACLILKKSEEDAGSSLLTLSVHSRVFLKIVQPCGAGVCAAQELQRDVSKCKWGKCEEFSWFALSVRKETPWRWMICDSFVCACVCVSENHLSSEGFNGAFTDVCGLVILCSLH